MLGEVVPPPDLRFTWRRWEPYPYPLLRKPTDPHPDSLIYVLMMGGYEVVRICLQRDGSWLIDAGREWSDTVHRTATAGSETEARDRAWRWAQKNFERLHRTRPMAYEGARHLTVPIPSSYHPRVDSPNPSRIG